MLVTAARTVSCVDTGWIADVLLHLNSIFLSRLHRHRGAPSTATAEACLQKKSFEKIVNCLTLRGAKDITSTFRPRMSLRWSNWLWSRLYIQCFCHSAASIDMLTVLVMRRVYSQVCPLGDGSAHLWCPFSMCLLQGEALNAALNTVKLLLKFPLPGTCRHRA